MLSQTNTNVQRITLITLYLRNKKRQEEVNPPHTQNKRETTAYIFLHIGLKENISWARFLQKSGNIVR